jgi:hypothetical protein|tara:strand:- start:804 stop:1820 length:1017 start_codon:yes stop_codon:yes gene_type:complete
MSELHTLYWDGGEIDIWSLGCKIVPKFKLNNKLVEPLHSANWIEDQSEDSNNLPGILKNLRGEFPCVPFGINSPIEEIANDWKEVFSKKPYVVNEPHGFSSNKNWELLEKTNFFAKFKIVYPKEDKVNYLIRTIEVDNNVPHNIKLSLTVVVKENCELPIGLHPMINVPVEKNKVKIKPGNFKFGLTYPGVLLSGKTMGAIGKYFSSIEEIPGFKDQLVDISQPPFDGNYEDLFQLCGIDGTMIIENYQDNYSFEMNWEPEHFSSVLIWLSNKGREEYPWNSKHTTIGLEPVTSAFGLSTHMSNNPNNPINKKGIKTTIKFKKNEQWKTEYNFSIKGI